MKRQFFLLTGLLFCYSSAVFAQSAITISQEDMPLENVKYSVQAALPNAEVSFEETGKNFRWDFSFLSGGLPLTQTYLSLREFSSGYRFYFSSPLPNLAVPVMQNDFDFGELLPFTPEEIVSFYQTTGKRFAQMGFGMKVNKFAIAFPYSEPDVLYPLPLTYGKSETYYSTLTIPFEGLFYFNRDQMRVVTADGWGKLTTPYGSWQVLRVRHDLLQNDTIGIDAETGFRQDSVRTTEFHWLAKGMGVPVLSVSGSYDSEGRFNVNYINMLEKKELIVGLEAQPEAQNFNVFPIPAQDKLNIVLPSPVNNAKITVTDMQGKLVKQLLISGQSIYINVDHLPAGIYFLQLNNNGNISSQKIVVQK